MPRPAAPPYGERILRLAPAPLTGLDVWELQIKLIAWGSGPDPDGIGVPNQPVVINGTFDRATADAVKRFQNALALPITGVVDDKTFRAIDNEAALYPVLVHDLRCPCAKGKNTTPIRCRCFGVNPDTNLPAAPHPNEGVCTGFGNNRFMGTFLLDGITLPDGTALGTEQLDVYDKGERPGVDKVLLWAVRGLMRRAAVARIGVLAGYQCWHDNYHHTDLRRLRHRTATFHLGKTVEFYHEGTCAEYGQNPLAAPCGTCAAIRLVAITKCGFQQRWQQPNRVSVGETGRDGPPPFSPYAVLVSTVRRKDKELNDFVNTYHASLQPLYPFRASSFSYPVDLGGGRDIAAVPSESYFQNTERGAHGWFPVGASRLWHGGVHIFAGAGTEVLSMADGEIVGCRAGEAETHKTLGSRNFVLVRHKHNNVDWFSLYMHLDAGPIDAASLIPWRKALHERTVDHILLSAPAPVFLSQVVAGTNRLLPRPGFPTGARLAPAGGAAPADPRTAPILDPDAPPNSLVIALAAPPNTYAYTQMENAVLATVVPADAALINLIATNDLIAVNPPIRISAGELLGSIAAAPTDAALSPGGAFLHWETFSATQMLTGAGYTLVDVANAVVSLDRADLTTKLETAAFVKNVPDHVLIDADRAQDSVNLLPLRSAVVKMTNQWALAWKAALQSATPFSFLPDVGRDALGDLMDEYRWWTLVSPVPNSSVYHYHPVTLMLQLADRP